MAITLKAALEVAKKNPKNYKIYVGSKGTTNITRYLKDKCGNSIVRTQVFNDKTGQLVDTGRIINDAHSIYLKPSSGAFSLEYYVPKENRYRCDKVKAETKARNIANLRHFYEQHKPYLS